MSKWLNSFRQKRGSLSAVSGLFLEIGKNGATTVLTELTRGHQSGLSVPPQGLFPLEIEKNGATTALTELTRGHQSGLSVPPEGLFPLDRESILYGFEERLAIIEYDGDQTALHAHRIAYLDAFISVLSTLPATGPQRDWLDQRIQASLAWIETQGLYSIN